MVASSWAIRSPRFAISVASAAAASAFSNSPSIAYPIARPPRAKAEPIDSWCAAIFGSASARAATPWRTGPEKTWLSPTRAIGSAAIAGSPSCSPSWVIRSSERLTGGDDAGSPFCSRPSAMSMWTRWTSPRSPSSSAGPIDPLEGLERILGRPEAVARVGSPELDVDVPPTLLPSNIGGERGRTRISRLLLDQRRGAFEPRVRLLDGVLPEGMAGAGGVVLDRLLG